MITISTDLPPFKKRIERSLRRIVIIILSIIAFGIIKALLSGPWAPEKSDWMVAVPILAGAIILLLLISILSQVWILDSVIIDESSRKITIQIRRVDKVIIKGEYPIDEKLKVIVRTTTTSLGERYTLLIKYAQKKIWSETPSQIMGNFSGWNSAKFYKIEHEIYLLQQGKNLSEES